MAEIKNTFLKGKMNQDIDSRLLPNGEYREAINLMISRSEGSTVGEFENVLGNTSISNLNGDNAVIIGQYVNETTNSVYLFATGYNNVDGVRSTSSDNYIYELNLSTLNKVLLVKGTFLNFNQSFPMLGINLVEDLLFFTDNLNQPRKINISLANPGGVSNPTHYTTEDQISVAKYAPCEPILVLDRVDCEINGDQDNESTILLKQTNFSDIKIGDQIVPLNVQNPGALNSQWNQAIYVIGFGVANYTVILSREISVDENTKVQFQRSTMTNKTSALLSNGITTTVTVAGNNPVALTATYEFLVNATNWSPDITPIVGDIVTGTDVSANTTILTAVATYGAANGSPGDDDYQQRTKWTITLSKTTDIANGTGNTMNIGVNQNYESAWQGDANFLEDKFVRFSYRFKFEDNEYSLMAPFSQPMFIPKQFSKFGRGQESETVDMDNAYKSTILNWFENSVENIVLKTPMPYSTPALNSSNLLITDIDLLYKESDALAVKVLDTVDISTLLNPTTNFPGITWDDEVHGVSTTYYYAYDYASNKPYKTLPSSQTTRVYDKVPIKALAQELIGNRVVYGNYVDKHSSPASINFSAAIASKKPYKNNVVQYPYHNLKQNRTYQVGFVLSDRYGRQSDVILSSYDNLDGTGGSTVFSPYNTYNDQIDNPIIDWLGDSLNVTIDSAIGGATGPGEPGVWNATTNPLGWYSYKVVVKQQQQEYYNVYLPGFVNGLPITGNDEENKSSFAVLLSDNINKVPRNLNEVGPTDTEYSSSELLYIRVNNPSINNKTNRPYGYPRKTTPWNKQYFPGFAKQEVLSISTIRDMEITAIPFVASSAQGDYGQVGTTETAGVTVPNSIGSIPWGTSPITQPFYNSDLNPFAIKIDTTANGKISLSSTEVPIVPGGVGAITNANVSGVAGVNTMVPFLSVAETKPVYSLLEIFWETSLQGKIGTLNSLINSQYAGISSTSSSSASFPESFIPESKIGESILFITGGGTEVTDNADIIVSLQSAYAANDPNTDVKDLFNISHTGTDAAYDLETNSNAYFWYSKASSATPSSDVYNISIKVIYTVAGVDYTNYMPYVATLTNITPTFDDCDDPTGITITSTTIKTFAGKNGSVDTSNYTKELTYDLDPSQINFSTINSQFNMSTAGVLTVNPGVLVDLQTYTVVARIRDVNGDGLSNLCSITFTVGVQRVPRSICDGRQGTISAACTQSYQTSFLASNTTPAGSWPITVGGISFPQPTYDYNVRANYDGTATTGALTQGVMNIKPTLQSTLTPGGGSISCKYTIQHRNLGTTTWGQAVDTSNVVIGYETLSASFGNPDVDTKTFNIVGEYRVISNDITGEGCSAASGAASFFVDFDDATYPGGACTGPL